MLLAALSIAQAAQAQIDDSFGDAGYVTLGFDPLDATFPTDHGIVACPGPSGTLVAVGVASDFRRVVTAWLTPTGKLDTTFSDDGMESFDVTHRIHAAVGLCTGDGGIVLAYASNDSVFQPDRNSVYLIRIDAQTGQLDGVFGKGGRQRIDLDDAVDGLGDHTNITALAQGADHDVLLFGYTRLEEGPMAQRAGYVVRLTATGTHAATQVTRDSDATIVEIVAAGAAGDGSIWIGGNRRQATSAYITGFLARLDGDDLSLLDMPQPSLGDNNLVFGGRLIGPARMGLVGSNYNDDFFATADLDGTQRVALDSGHELQRPQILRMPGGRLLIAASAVDFLSVGTWFAQLRPSARGRYVLDTSFGDGGSFTASAALPPECPGEEVQVFNRITLWNGAPTAIGALNRNCGGSPDFDYLLLRLRADLVFDDGLEGG